MKGQAIKASVPLSPQQVQEFLAKNKERHLSNKVLHAHPSPAHWVTDFDMQPVESSLAHRPTEDASVNMYMGIPYCLPTDPPHCGFCLFPTEKYQGKSDASGYLDVMAQEARMYVETYQSTTIESLYIGGGTPNLLQPSDYGRLMEIARLMFPRMRDDIEKTLEGIPQLFTEDKILAIKEAGFNRVSMGVQQVDDALIKYSGRKQTNQQVFDAIDNFNKHGLACNVDLIYGWPEQTVPGMLDGLRSIVRSGIRHITHYELNIAGRSDFATKQRALVPSIDQKYRMYCEAKAFLQAEGFVQRTVYDWERPGEKQPGTALNPAEYNYEQNLRDGFAEKDSPKRSYMGGIGYAAINIRLNGGWGEAPVPAVSTMNHKSLSAYIDAVASGKRPIERAYVHNREDIRLCWIFQSLQEMRLNMARYTQLFGSDILSDYDAVFDALNARSWIETRGHELLLVNEGEFSVPLIQSLISQARIKEMSSPRKHIPILAAAAQSC
jgi:oxygen-independent coproporphyrinogen-3 oxidase